MKATDADAAMVPLRRSGDVPLNHGLRSGTAGLDDESLATPDLVAQVADRLRQRILSGELAPHAELPPEGRMTETFGVSRTVVREAMRHLRAQDLVEVTRGRRPRVRPVDPQSAIDTLNTYVLRSGATLYQLIEVRRALESEVAGLAAARATEGQLAALVEANEQMRVAATSELRVHHDWLFHERLAEASNNPIFVLLTKTIASLFELSLVRTSHSDANVAYASHGRLISAIRRQDPRLARDVALENLQLTEYDLERS